MSDRIGIMINGRLEQLAPVHEVYSSPASLQAAEFLGPVNRFPAALLPRLECGPGAAALQHMPDSTMLYCRAESLQLIPDAEGNARIESVIFAGILVQIEAAVADIHGTEHRLQIFSLENGVHRGSRARVCLSHAAVLHNTEEESHA